MGNSFDKITKSKLYELGSILWDIVALSLLWLIFSIPVITSAASSSALYFALYRRIKKESDNAVPDFMRSFAGNLKQSIPLSLLYVLFAAVIAFNINIARYGIGGVALPEWYLPFALLLIVPYLVIYPFAYPYLARFCTNTTTIIKNAAAFSAMNPGKAILLFILSFASIALMILFPPCLLVMPFTAAYLRVLIVEKIFEAAIEREHKAGEEEDTEDMGETDA